MLWVSLDVFPVKWMTKSTHIFSMLVSSKQGCMHIFPGALNGLWCPDREPWAQQGSQQGEGPALVGRRQRHGSPVQHRDDTRGPQRGTLPAALP